MRIESLPDLGKSCQAQGQQSGFLSLVSMMPRLGSQLKVLPGQEPQLEKDNPGHTVLLSTAT